MQEYNYMVIIGDYLKPESVSYYKTKEMAESAAVNRQSLSALWEPTVTIIKVKHWE